MPGELVIKLTMKLRAKEPQTFHHCGDVLSQIRVARTRDPYIEQISRHAWTSPKVQGSRDLTENPGIRLVRLPGETTDTGHR